MTKEELKERSFWPELKHHYSKKVHLFHDPYCSTLLAKASSTDYNLPQLYHAFEVLYRALLGRVFGVVFPLCDQKKQTRMGQMHPEAILEGEFLSSEQRVVVVDLARAGTFPSHICFQELHSIIDPKLLRQDHVFINRRVNAKSEVIGVDFSGSKIGGDQEAAIVLFPDPMGATGSSLSHVLSEYKNKVNGKASKYVVMNLIITPEFIKRISTDHPDVEIFAFRLDRGLSPSDVLKTIPGTHPDKERGLNEKHYIVPGAGGIGELLNNSPI